MKQGMTISEKILARAAGLDSVMAGDTIEARADTLIFCDLAWLLAGPPIRELGAKVVDPDRVVVVFDHKVPADNTASAELHRNWREFCAEQGITRIYDVGEQGISHVISVEHGYARPGTLQVNIDSHANTCGAVGCFAVALGMDIVSDMVLGRNWHVVPETIRVNLEGELPDGVMVRDLAQRVMTDLGDELGLGRAIEFVGPVVERMPLGDRMTLCNWSRKVQAVAGVMAPSPAIFDYVRRRTTESFEPVFSDDDAAWIESRDYRVDATEPLVAAPSDPLNTQTLEAAGEVAIQQAFIGSCAGGSLEDIRVAAEILSGRKVHGDVRMIVSPGSEEVSRRADGEGLLSILRDAGCVVTASTCGACIGGMGALAAGEVCISTSTENFKGRMGSRDSSVYLGSPRTVAASALRGRLTDPRSIG
jgi:3-isopropylmalate/(R)-2-methylmalate dehydratase large subunit